jgi:RNA polymerase sigma-70 factor (ECF subfamily)
MMEGMAVTEDLIGRVKAGDEHSFRQLIGPYQGELQLHCYRILGSAHDAEDALQETLLAAWRGLADFEGRSSVRTWLYRVATNCCLKALRSASRRPPTNWPPPGVNLPEPSRLGEVVWLQPYPDILLEGLPPLPLEYHGRDPVARFLAATGLRPGRRSRLVPTRANGQPAFGLYAHDPQAGIWHATGLLVLTLTGDKVCAMTGFDTSVPPLFGLPRTLPG